MQVGIDLGTTYSLIARMDQDGRPGLLPDRADRELVQTPSTVYVDGRAAFVGGIVDVLLEQDPDLPVVRFFKRSLGETAPLLFDKHGNGWLPESIAALVLKKLRGDAENFTMLTVDGATISVPAHFNDLQRRAVQAAALLADLPLTGLVDEPVAAALHYGVTRGVRDRSMLVFDWGGGTFDATVMTLTDAGVTVLATGGVTTLGGKELDDAISTRVLEQFERVHGRGAPLSARALLELQRTSERLKIELCTPGVQHARDMVMLAGEAIEVRLRRDEFLADIAVHLDRAEASALECVEQAGLGPADIDDVLLVGGSSLVPAVEERLRALFSRAGQQVLHHEPSKAVAFGAALRAAQLAGEAERFEVPPEFRGVTGYAVGVRTADVEGRGPAIDTLIKQNMPLPLKVTKTYYSTRADQQRIVLDLVQFRAREEATAVSLGLLVIGPLPSPRQNYPVQVTVEALEDGTIHVQASDRQTGIALQQTFGRRADGFGHLAAQHALVRATIINNL